MSLCMPPHPVVPQHRLRASQRLRACAVLLAVLMLLVSTAAQAAPGAARRPASPFDFLSALGAWLVAQIAPAGEGEGGVTARTPDSAEEAGLISWSAAGNSDAGGILDPDGGH